MSKDIKDLSIIGAGPVGMYATTYALIRQMSVNLFDTLPTYGGQPNSMYPQKYVYDLPMFAKVEAEVMIKNLAEQIEFNRKDLLTEYFNTEIVGIKKKEDYFVVTTSTGEEFYSKTVLLTIGGGILETRKIGLDNEADLPNILYHVKDLSVFNDKDVTILGGGDSALDWTIMIDDIATNVNIVHRRDQYRAKEDSIEKLHKTTVKQYLNYIVDSIEDLGNGRTKLVIEDKETGEKKEIEQDYVLVNYGNASKRNDFGGLDLNKVPQGYVTDRVCQTNIEGIYACGNASTFEGKPKLITVGFGEVPIAINAIKGYVDPSTKGKVFYSTTMGKE